MKKIDLGETLAAHRRRLPSWVIGVGCALVMHQGAAAAASALELKSLSSKPQFVSGADVLLEVAVPDAVDLATVKVLANGVDVTPAFHSGPPGHTLRGLVPGLQPGANTLVARAPGLSDAHLIIHNHPITGPIISGPQISPFECRTAESGLGPAKDANCSADTKVEFFYRSKVGKFQPLPSGDATPGDVATTTTSAGRTVPYVIRVESGVINRAIYRIAVLGMPPAGSNGQTPLGWNGRLVVGFGGGCGVHYNQGGDSARDALSDVELSRGYAYIVSPTLVNQQFCNPTLQGETLMMIKEHFIKTVGPPRWTTGFGGSGGAIQQYLIAQMFPGLLDGVIAAASFPDSQLQAPFDGEVLAAAFAKDPTRWTPEKRAAVVGVSPSTFADWRASFGPLTQATPEANPKLATAGGPLVADNDMCGLRDKSKIFDQKHNPEGVRCSMYDAQANLLGRYADGWVRRPWDDVGVQFGLKSLNDGAITVDDFLVLNEEVGGFDKLGGVQPDRSVGDPIAIRNAYATGLVNSGGGGLALTPIITLRNYYDKVPAGSLAAIHDRAQDFIIRTRLKRANGTADNQVIWTAASFTLADFHAAPIDLMAVWQDALAGDPAPLSAAKIARFKPAAAVDTCWGPNGEKVVEPASYDAPNRCNGWYPNHQEPRTVAGEPLASDVYKCRLRPVNMADYKVNFTLEQKTRLRRIFKSGVCDFAVPGEFQGPIRGTYLSLPLTTP